MLPEICGVCHRTSGVLKTDVDTVHNGRGAFARKTLEIQSIQEIDQYTGILHIKSFLLSSKILFQLLYTSITIISRIFIS